MNVLVIGGTGHIGSFLVPMLVADGHKVAVVSRGERKPLDNPAWEKVRLVKGAYRRSDAAVASIVKDAACEVVIDILGANVPAVYDAARAKAKHLICCGSVWMLGPSKVVPTPPEEQSPCPFEGYALRWRELKETCERARKDGLAFTAILPPNICGPGKVPIDTRGGRSVEVHKSACRGEPVTLPENCNTLIAPCDASDVARPFALAVNQRDAAADGFFNAGAPYAMTAPRFVEAWGEIFGVRLPIHWVSADVFYKQFMPDIGDNYHFREHMSPDISKTRAKLGYEPQFTCEQSMARAFRWMREKGLL